VGIATFPGLLHRNPYQRLLYNELAAQGFVLVEQRGLNVGWLWRARRVVRVLHFHWPQGYWRYNRSPKRLFGLLSWVMACAFVGRLLVARALRYRIVWTIHQVYPHEVLSRRLDRFGAVALARLSHLLIVHDAGTSEAAQRELGRSAAKIHVVKHGSFIGVYRPGRPRDRVRAELDIAAHAFVFLCFGELRAYKEVESLLDAFRATNAPGAVLLIAGTIGDERHAAAVRTAAALDPRIIPLLGFVEDDRVAELFGACDAAVLARGDGGTSGALILALSMGLPVVAARTQSYMELTAEGAAGWLFAPGDPASLRDSLERAYSEPKQAHEAKGRSARKVAETLRWPEIGKRTAELIRGLDDR
jgi:glycosyltransferase involved in cell wall biosynthesis